MRTCIYARKSTHKLGQKETIENQIKICKRYAQDHKLDVVEIKQDTGTGTDDLNRPEVKSLIQDAIDGKYQCVIMKGISRLYRDTEKGLGLIKMLDRHNVRVITIEEMFDSGVKENRTGTGKLDLSRITMYLMFSEMESKKLADRIKYVQMEKAKNGQWNQVSSTPFGYSFDPETKHLIINTIEAQTVKLIFDLYEQGMGIRKVMHYLNGENSEGKAYSAPSTDIWNQYTVGFILQNEAYIGSVVYNKRSKRERTYKRPDLFGKSKGDIWVGNEYNDREEWVIKENAHEAIISKEKFEKVQQILKTKAKRKGIRSNVSLFAGIAKCGKCNNGMTFKRGRKNDKGWIVTKDNYYCMQYIKYGKNYCSSHHIGADELEEIVVESLHSLLKNPNDLNDVFNEAKRLLPKDNENLIKEKLRIDLELRKITDKMDILLEKNLEGNITDLQFQKMNDKYSKNLTDLSSQLEEITLKLQDKNNAEDFEKLFRNKLNEAINIDIMDKEEKRYLYLQLIDQIIVNEDHSVDIQYKFEP